MLRKVILVLLLLGFISTLSFGQVFSHTNNIAQHIVGTWTNVETPREAIIFNANGTGLWDGDDFRWVVIGNKIAFVFIGDETYVEEIYISNDGKFLILYGKEEGFLFQKR